MVEQDFLMLTLSDRVFIALAVTLALFVLIIEWRSKRLIAPQLQPNRITDWNLRDINVPHRRPSASVIEDVAYMDITDAADAGGE